MRLILFVSLIFIVINGQIVRAQDYIYSVTLGTSWARQEFPAQERLQRKALAESNYKIDGAPQFTKTFLDFERDYKKYNTYNDSIFYSLTHEEWIDLFKRRSEYSSNLYSFNNKKIDEVKNYFLRDNVPSAAYDSLFYWTRHLFFRNVNDMFLFEQLIDIILPYYEKQNDIEHLSFCYLCAGMYNFQCSRMGDKDAEEQSLYYFKKVMAYSDNFASFKDPLCRFYYISAYVNLALLHAQIGNVSMEESLEMTKDMQKLYSLPKNQEFFESDSLLNEYAKWSVDLFRFRGILTYFSQGIDNALLRDQLYKLYSDVREEIGISPDMKNRYYAKLDYDDLLIEAFMGNISWDDAFNLFDEKLKVDKEITNNTGVPTIKINYLYNLFESFVVLIEKSSLPKDLKGDIMKNSVNDVLDKISRYEHSRYPFEKGRILTNIACNPNVYKYYDSKEKEDLIFRLIVLEQPSTYVHVSMVADLARILSEDLINKRPGFFTSIPGYRTTRDVKAKKKELLDFIYQSAVFHDLGKISMPSVINNGYRRLTNHEYDIIKTHPESAVQFFNIDAAMKQYQDIALGHHKWYDGEGYPASFNNRISPYFPVICVITLCDCLDAGTENLGRNYHSPKTVDMLLNEFEEASAEQFHPALINFIRSNPETYDKMKAFVREGRYDNYYKLFKRFMTKDKE